MHPLTQMLLAISVSGGLGGIVVGMIARNSHQIRLPILGRSIEIAFLGDALVGAVSSVAVFFLAAPILGLDLSRGQASVDWLKIISLGVLSGLVATKYLTASTSHIRERILLLDDRMEQLNAHGKVTEILRRADSLAVENRLEHALAKYDEALHIDPGCEAAHLGKAQALHNRCKWDDAVKTLSRLLESNPSSERAYYNRACYKSASGKYRKEEILQDLKNAVALDPLYKIYAALQENHFENLRDDPDFRKIVE